MNGENQTSNPLYEFKPIHQIVDIESVGEDPPSPVNEGSKPNPKGFFADTKSEKSEA